MGQNGGLKIWYNQRNSYVLREYNFSTRFLPLYLPTLHSISQSVLLIFFIQASIEKFPNSLRMHFAYYFIHNQYMEINSTRAKSLSVHMYSVSHDTRKTFPTLCCLIRLHMKQLLPVLNQPSLVNDSCVASDLFQYSLNKVGPLMYSSPSSLCSAIRVKVTWSL